MYNVVATTLQQVLATEEEAPLENAYIFRQVYVSNIDASSQ